MKAATIYPGGRPPFGSSRLVFLLGTGLQDSRSNMVRIHVCIEEDSTGSAVQRDVRHVGRHIFHAKRRKLCGEYGFVDSCVITLCNTTSERTSACAARAAASCFLRASASASAAFSLSVKPSPFPSARHIRAFLCTGGPGLPLVKAWLHCRADSRLPTCGTAEWDTTGTIIVLNFALVVQKYAGSVRSSSART